MCNGGGGDRSSRVSSSGSSWRFRGCSISCVCQLVVVARVGGGDDGIGGGGDDGIGGGGGGGLEGRSSWLASQEVQQEDQKP